jgi:hypothetical protein
MAKLSRDLGTLATLHPRENLFATGNLATNGAEVIVAADGSGVVALDLRGTFNLTVEVAGTVDGTNWVLIPMRSRLGGIYLANVAGVSQGSWVGDCTGYRQVRARCTAYNSGSATTVLLVEPIPFVDMLMGAVTPSLGTATGASGAAVTLTLASPGAGLRHYLTYLSVNRFAAAVLTPAATPVLVTTTNLPGSLALSMPADAAAQGTLFPWREDFAYPLVGVAQATATTIVCPATTGVIWRVTAGFYVAP